MTEDQSNESGEIFCNREGRKLCEAFDQNQNGLPERLEWFNLEGRRQLVGEDRDENGIVEILTEFLPDGSKMVWRDKNQDGNYERVEVLSGDGTVLLVQELSVTSGFLTVR